VAAVTRLGVWSGPRNISTALMRAWENRPDTQVVDEPLYAHFLDVTGIDHPGRDEVVASGETDWRVVVHSLFAPVPAGVRVFYQKHMAHHLVPDVDTDWIPKLTNVLLIRDPREVVASYLHSRDHVTADDIGLRRQTTLYDDLSAAGARPPIIDAADFLKDPERYLRALCELVDVGFDECMLAWPPGPRQSDGSWAPYWYDAVWRSTGFAPYRKRQVSLTGQPAAVAEEALPLYQRLAEARWLPD
jgi:Sulfotransferase domain